MSQRGSKWGGVIGLVVVVVVLNVVSRVFDLGWTFF